MKLLFAWPLWGLLALSPSLAQSPAVSPGAAPSASSFPSEPYIITKALTSVLLSADATNTRVLTFGIAIQSEAALRQFSVVSIAFASRSEKADFLYVRVTHADGTTQETSVADAIEQPAPVTREAPFYSDLKTKELPVKSLRIGDTLEWQARFTVEHPEVTGQSWGQDSFIDGAVVLDETYELRAPAGFHITAWTEPRVASTFSESQDGGTHIFRWHNTRLRPTVGAEADAFNKAEETRVRTAAEELDATKGVLPSFAWSTFSDWAAVGAWYHTLTTDRATPDDAIRAKVAQLTAGKTTDLEKAQAIYNYVSSQIRYIGVAFGIGRYQPHTAAEIFANQYGDCKDKHTLLASMLSVLNLPAEPVLVGAGIRFNPAVASPAAFNHLITRVRLDGKDILLDSTAEIGPWGALVPQIRDQEALVIPTTANAVLIQTPKDLPYPSISTFAVTGSLDKDLTSDSKIALTIRNDDELIFRSVLRSVSPSNYGVFVQQTMSAMGFGGTTSEPSFDHIDDPSEPLRLNFHYHRIKEKDWGENRITVIFEEISLPAYSKESPPVIAIQLGALRTETSQVEMQLPEGWTAQLPQSIHAHTTFATCDVTYHLDKGKLFAERRLTVLKDKLPVTDYKQYQSWYDEAGISGVPYIQLVPPIKSISTAILPQPDAPKAPASLAGIQPSDPKAAELVQKAFNNIRAMDLDAARENLDQAREINPTEPHLWIGYGAVAEMLGKPTEIISNVQHELSFHPEEVEYYSQLAQGQIRQGDPQAALVTLRAWVKAAPSDPHALALLVFQLSASKIYSEKAEVCRVGLKHLEDAKADPNALRSVQATCQVAFKPQARPAKAATNSATAK